MLIIFDWSGTISDDRMPVYLANKRLRKHFSLSQISFEEFLQTSNKSIYDLFMSEGVKVTRKSANSLYKKYLNDLIKGGICPRIYPDAEEAIRILHGNGENLAVLSSHPIKNLKAEIREYGLGNFFSLVLGDSEDKSGDLAKICGELRTAPRGSAYVGDIIYDVRAAKSAGLRSIAVCGGYHSRERLAAEIPSRLIGSLIQLVDLLPFDRK